MSDLFQQLAAPFPPDRVSWRVGSTNKDKTKGMALAYIDARDVMDRLDDLVGPGGWQCSYPHANGKTVCRISIRIDGEWIGKEDGAGDTDVEAEKGALSDAFKRAAVRWGIGRYLYDLASPWVTIEPMGRSFKIADSEYPKLRNLLGGKAPPRQPEPMRGDTPKAPSEEAPAFGFDDTQSVEAYKAMVLAGVKMAKSSDGLARLWKDQTANRKRFNLENDRGIGLELVTAFQDRKAELLDAERDAA